MMKLIKRFSTILLTASVAASAMQISASAKELDESKTYKVMMINFDPIFDVNGQEVKMHDLMEVLDVENKFFQKWNNPYDLADRFAKAMSEVSYGNVNYTVAEKIELNEFPLNKEGKAYTTDEYYHTLVDACNATNGRYWEYNGWNESGYSFDYENYFNKYDVYEKVNSGEIDEVWFFGGPMLGVTLYETMMAGKDAFWVNGEAIVKEDCRNFIAYGFNYERELGEMLEDAGHRTESIMNNVFGCPDYTKDYSEYNDWEKFTAYDLVSKGNSGVGNVHFAPNSKSDYDWGNTDNVQSYCDNWYNYPDISGVSKTVNCSLWGDGNTEKHHRWWFRHLPHADGINEVTGKFNNWWKYFSLEYLNDSTVESRDITECTFSSIPDVTYTGSAIKPSVTVTDEDKVLTLNEDYTIIYENNIDIGTASAVICGINDYEGTYVINFEIVPADVPDTENTTSPQNVIMNLIMMLMRMLFSYL